MVLNILRIWVFFFQHVLDLFDGCMIVHLSFSHVFGNVTSFLYVCIGFIWWVHECPPVVLVLFNGCMIVHLLFSHIFGSVTSFAWSALLNTTTFVGSFWLDFRYSYEHNHNIAPRFLRPTWQNNIGHFNTKRFQWISYI